MGNISHEKQAKFRLLSISFKKGLDVIKVNLVLRFAVYTMWRSYTSSSPKIPREMICGRLCEAV